jgi:hypothetical protein
MRRAKEKETTKFLPAYLPATASVTDEPIVIDSTIWYSSTSTTREYVSVTVPEPIELPELEITESIEITEPVTIYYEPTETEVPKIKTKEEDMNEKKIARIAERLWVEAGHPDGRSEEFWNQAVRIYEKDNNDKSIDCWTLIENVIGQAERILLYGVSGTGKSWAARKTNLESEVYSVSLTEDTPAAELRGHYGLRGGEYEWMDGPCVNAWRFGTRLCLNELEKASDDAQTFLLGILDDKEIAQQTLPNGETIKPHDKFHVIATMNGHPDKDLNSALRDRFPVCIHIDKASPEALARLPEDIRGAAQNTSVLKDSQRQISVRVWNEYSKLRNKIGDQAAAMAIFGDRAKMALDNLKIVSK